MKKQPYLNNKNGTTVLKSGNGSTEQWRRDTNQTTKEEDNALRKEEEKQ